MLTVQRRNLAIVSLLAAAMLPVAASAQDQLRPNGGISGAIGRHHPVGPDGGRFLCFALQTRAGERYNVTLLSEVFSPVIRVGKGRTCDSLSNALEDRKTEGERLANVELAGDGDLWLIAAIAPAGGTGAYHVGVERTVTAPATPRPITFGQTLTGALTPDDALTIKNVAYDCYSFQAARGDDLIVSMRSSAYKPAVALYTGADCQGTPINFENEGGDGEATLTESIANTEIYSIRARSLLRDVFGPYTVTLRRR